MLQLTLPGISHPTPPSELRKHRLFFAVLLPNRAGMQTTALTQELLSEYELYGTPLECNRLHVSLLGSQDLMDRA